MMADEASGAGHEHPTLMIRHDSPHRYTVDSGQPPDQSLGLRAPRHLQRKTRESSSQWQSGLIVLGRRVARVRGVVIDPIVRSIPLEVDVIEDHPERGGVHVIQLAHGIPEGSGIGHARPDDEHDPSA